MNCVYCGRPVNQVDVGRALMLPGKPVVCRICKQSAIYQDHEAKPIVEQVGGWLQTQGFQFGGVTLDVQLMESLRLAKYNSGQIPGNILGVTLKQSIPCYGGIIVRRVLGIGLLWGLPRDLLAGVAAHELGHAWLFVNKIDQLEPWCEEGFCNLLSYLWYSQHQTQDGVIQMSNLKVNPDPVYGAGFRRIFNILQRRKLTELIHYLEVNHALPS